MATKKKTGSDFLQAPKGFRDIIGDEVFLYQGLAEKAAEIALYYGFKPIELPMLEHEEVFVRGVGTDTDIVSKELYSLRTKGGDHLTLRPEGTAGVMRAYFEQGMQSWPQPVMLYYYGPFFRHENTQRGRYRQFWQFGFEIIGSAKSVNDALTIRLITLVLAEAGIKNPTVTLNSIGDNTCRPIYRRELVNYYKKHIRDICADCRERLKTNPLRLLDCKNPNCAVIKEGAPEAISYLCHACQQHFTEVLEYLEAMNIPFVIDKTLVRGLDYYSRTVFEITAPPADLATPGETATEPAAAAPAPLAIASGGRYDYLAKSFGAKKEVPGVGGAIGIDRVIALPDMIKLAPRIVKKPKVFFIQLGFEAKLKSLEVIEIIRQAKIPLAQSLAKDSLATQLGQAERLGVPFTVIFGQKEAIDGTVIVRNMDNRSQDTVKIVDLAEHLKKIK